MEPGLTAARAGITVAVDAAIWMVFQHCTGISMAVTAGLSSEAGLVAACHFGARWRDIVDWILAGCCLCQVSRMLSSLQLHMPSLALQIA